MYKTSISYLIAKAELTLPSWHQQLNLFPLGVRPALDDGRPQLNVGLVHLAGLPHVDLQVLPDQSKEGCREPHLEIQKR